MKKITSTIIALSTILFCCSQSYASPRDSFRFDFPEIQMNVSANDRAVIERFKSVKNHYGFSNGGDPTYFHTRNLLAIAVEEANDQTMADQVLIEAVQYNDAYLAAHAIKHGAKATNFECYPLIRRAESLVIVNLLLSAGASLDIEGRHGSTTMLHETNWSNYDPSVLELYLQEYPSYVNYPDTLGRTPLEHLVVCAEIEGLFHLDRYKRKASLLIQAGADISTITNRIQAKADKYRLEAQTDDLLKKYRRACARDFDSFRRHILREYADRNGVTRPSKLSRMIAWCSSKVSE